MQRGVALGFAVVGDADPAQPAVERELAARGVLGETFAGNLTGGGE